MTDTPPPCVRFGDFELDLRRGELRQGERTIVLQEQPFQVLTMLVERDGEIATREEIQKKLWPNDTVVEFDQSINAAIKKLRKALGDSAEEPRYIRTVAKHGYRLIVPVERVQASADDSGDSEKIPAQAKDAWTGHPPGSTSLTGKTVSHYRVLEILGGGGMGVVYRAEDLKLGRAVALKFLPEELGDDPKALERFEREARAASALDHPNICSIYEFGEHEGQPFIVMQLLEGQTLREHLASLALQKSSSDGSCPQALPLDHLLDVATQIANGLQAAHERGIIHRDIKPANIFLTTRGLVKILDFGVAKLVEAGDPEQAAAANSESGTVSGHGFSRAVPASSSNSSGLQPANATDPPTDQPHATPDSFVSGHDFSRAAPAPSSNSSGLQPAADPHLTRTGAAMGTAGYMSPEQVRGEKVDARTDLFSFGLVLYEMATGQRAFSGDTAAIVRDAILTQTPRRAHEVNSTIPPGLEQIINRAIEKEREWRYQTAAEMRADLQSLTVDQSKESGKSGVRSRWKWLAAAALAVICLGIIAGGAYWRSRNVVTLTDKDTIVLADFDNKTGDAVFDDTLKQGVSVQLEQSPFLNLLSGAKVNATLKLMGRDASDHLTPEVAREICQRTGSNAVLTGSVAGLGSEYVIGLKVVNCDTGDVLAEAQEQATGKEAVLKALDAAAVALRSRLGESLSSVTEYATPLEQATTPSLEALKAYSLGQKALLSRGETAALPFFQRAVELDPNFAMPYAAISVVYSNLDQGGRSAENARRAFELRAKVSDRERWYIEGNYYLDATGELEKAAQIYGQWRQRYPRDYVPYSNLAFISMSLGKLEEFLQETQETLRLTPDNAYLFGNLATGYEALNRLHEAEAVLKQAQDRKLESENLLQNRYQLAFLKHDTAQMTELTAAAAGKPGTYDELLADQADTEAFYGKLNDARELTRRAMEAAQNDDAKEAAAMYQAEGALREVESGNREQARADAVAAVRLAPDRDVRFVAGLALALAGDTAAAEKLAAGLDKEFPLDTLIQRYRLPTMRAAVALEHKDPTRAIEFLQVTSPIELGDGRLILPIYLRALAYLMLRDGKAAGAEFQRFIQYHGLSPNFQWQALAHLGLARAYALEAATDPASRDKARTAYQNFLTLWKDADPDIPIYQQAKAEYAKLR